MNNPLADPYFVLDKVYGGGKYLKQSLAETPVEPLYAARTTKICYGVLEKDIYLDYILGANCQKAPKRAVKLIIKIALYMLEFMDKHDYMVVDNAVDLTKKLGKGGAAGFVNAFLRSYKVPELPKTADEAISIRTSAPLWLVKRVKRSYKARAEGILAAPSKGVCVRYERPPFREDSRRIETPFEGAYIYPNFVRDGGFFEGAYTFQSVGSIAVCAAVPSCDKLLDCCAAPGGKSVLLSRRCKSVTAQEVYPHREKLIGEYAARMGVESVSTICADATVYNPDFCGAFDCVLCDVPCSGTGVINENPDIKLFRKESDIAELCGLQGKILANCSRYVKSGGYLIYSTCSVLPEENDSAVYNFLNGNSEFSLDLPQSPLEHITTKFGLQFLPDISLGAGFFVSRMKRK